MTYWDHLLHVFYNTTWDPSLSVADRWRQSYEVLQRAGVR